ncbi:uncharacterized protein LOC129708799 [Leucoraja erinacea]|uniref:uncharacterized protein LOC129708799 n=1 Tax=Leucoraja erinaceus TaxID=7782 RepID=UPI002456C8EA|nr:uncharacterized protein LOC129708799 [Leucoraja erinacea]
MRKEMLSTSRIEEAESPGIQLRQRGLLEPCLKPKGTLALWNKGLQDVGEQNGDVWRDRFSGIRDQEGIRGSLQWEGGTSGVQVQGDGRSGSLQKGEGLPGVHFQGGWRTASVKEGKKSLGMPAKGEGIPVSFQSAAGFSEGFGEDEMMGSKLWGEELSAAWDGNRAPRVRMCAALVNSATKLQGDLLLNEHGVHPQGGDAQVEPGGSEDNERVGPEVEDGEVSPMELSFSGSGFLVTYQIGVAECLLENLPQVVLAAPRVFGASAGSLIAAAVVCGVDLDCFYQTLSLAAKQSRRWFLGLINPLFSPLQIVKKGLVENLHENAYERACGRLFISMTRASDGQNILVSDFSSNEELIQALLCSCFVPVYCGLVPPTFRGVRYIDGGFTNSQPLYDKKNTITISPFSGEIDICPRDFVDCFLLCFANCTFGLTPENLRRIGLALFPPSPKVLQRFLWNGYSDTLLYMQTNNMLSLDAPIIVKILSNYHCKKRLQCLATSGAEEANRRLQFEASCRARWSEGQPSRRKVRIPKALLSMGIWKSSIFDICSLVFYPIHYVTSVAQRFRKRFLRIPNAIGSMFKNDVRRTTELPNVSRTERCNSAHCVHIGSI